MAAFRAWLDNLPKVVKIIFTILFGNIYGCLYRISGGTAKNIVLGILFYLLNATCVVFLVIMIIDLIKVIKDEHPICAD